MLPLLARYQWGDLRKGVNKKQIKNDKKKALKREKKDKKKDVFKIVYEPTVVKFD